MKIELELWHGILLLLAFFSCVGAFGKLLLSQIERHLDQRFAAQEASRASNHQEVERRLSSIESTTREESGQWQRVERELLSLKAELPVNYVRREDYIRGQSVIESKLDGLAGKLENAHLRGVIANSQGGNHAY